MTYAQQKERQTGLPFYVEGFILDKTTNLLQIIQAQINCFIKDVLNQQNVQNNDK